jgi:predicted outer membrane repeat protein
VISGVRDYDRPTQPDAAISRPWLKKEVVYLQRRRADLAVRVYLNQALSGAGITNFGRLVIQNSSIEENTSPSYAGGIYNSTLGTLEINNSLVHQNSAHGYGGGIYTSGTITVTRSTISENTGSYEDLHNLRQPC